MFTVYVRALGQTFDDHARAVVDLLREIVILTTAKDESACDEAGSHLLQYTIGASCYKMYTRLKPSNTYSSNFFNALTHLDVHWDRYNPNPPFTPKGSPKYSSLEENFLDFIIEIQKLNMIENLSIPHLLELATAFGAQRKAVHHLYTQDTYREIHHLLCKLLAVYREQLHELTEFQKSLGKDVLSDRIRDVTFTGLCLHTMAYGPILERHFDNMSDILGRLMQTMPWVQMTTPNNPESRTTLPESKSHPLDQDDPDPESYQDSELIAIQPRTKLTETTAITTSQ